MSDESPWRPVGVINGVRNPSGGGGEEADVGSPTSVALLLPPLPLRLPLTLPHTYTVRKNLTLTLPFTHGEKKYLFPSFT